MILRPLLSAALIAMLLASADPPAVGTVQPGGQTSQEPFVLGVLRGDGILLPFASFDGRKWARPWPAGLPRELPATLEAVPKNWWGRKKPESWRVWPRDSMESPKTFKLVSPVTFGVGMMRRHGLRTDYAVSPPPVPPLAFPFPKVGLAVGGEADVRPITITSVRAPVSRRMMQSIRADINEAEERAIRGLRSSARWSHPVPPAARYTVDPVLEAWYTAPLAQPGFGISYIEAVKAYPPQPEDAGCGLESFITGWLHHDQDAATPQTDLDAVVTYCDRDRASYMLPLGQILARDQIHWVYQLSGHRSEWYVVVETTRGRTRYVAEYLAGGVPGPR